MNRTIHIKHRLPFNWNYNRPMKLEFHFEGRSTEERILPSQNRKFEIGNSAGKLKMRMGHIKSEIAIPAGREDMYLTIGVKGNNALAWFYHYGMPVGIDANVVAPEEFVAFDDRYAESQTPLKRIDSVSFFLSLGVMAYLLYAIFTGDSTDDIASLVWATAVIGVTTLLILRKDRKKISVFTYKSRMFLFGGLLAVTTFTMAIEHGLELGWLVVLLPLTVLARTWMVDKAVPTA